MRKGKRQKCTETHGGIQKLAGLLDGGSALDTAKGSDRGVGDVSVNDTRPRLASGEVVVELGSDLADLGEAGPGDLGEVVVFVVVSDVKGEVVEGSVVRVGLVSLDKGVVLRDEVSSHGVETKTEEGSDEEVGKGLPSPVVDHEVVKGELDGLVNKLPLGRGLGVGEERAESVEGGLEEAPEGLLPGVVLEEVDLPHGRDISVDNISSLVLMVLHVVLDKRNTRGDSGDEVSKDGEKLVVHDSVEAEVVGELVNGKLKRVVHSASVAVGYEDEHRPRGSTSPVGGDHLSDENENHEGESFDLGSEEVADLWVLRQDQLTAGGMRFIGLGPLKVLEDVLRGRGNGRSHARSFRVRSHG